MLHVEWYHVCWPRLTAKCVEPVVSISWASCCNTCYNWQLSMHWRENVSHVSNRCVHPKSYIVTTDGRDYGGKPPKWRWGRVLLRKIPEFCSMGGNIIFDLQLKITKLSWKNCFRTVASPGACERLRLAVLNWRSSSINPSYYYNNYYLFFVVGFFYMFLYVFITIPSVFWHFWSCDRKGSYL